MSSFIAFIFFCQENREELKKSNPSLNETEIIVKLLHMWKREKDQNRYEKMAEECITIEFFQKEFQKIKKEWMLEEEWEKRSKGKSSEDGFQKIVEWSNREEERIKYNEEIKKNNEEWKKKQEKWKREKEEKEREHVRKKEEREREKQEKEAIKKEEREREKQEKEAKKKEKEDYKIMKIILEIKLQVKRRVEDVAFSIIPHRFFEEFKKIIGDIFEYQVDEDYNYKSLYEHPIEYADKLFSKMETKIDTNIEKSTIPYRLHLKILEIIDKANTGWLPYFDEDEYDEEDY